MSIALKCEIFIVMRYEQLCVLCLVCVECESPSNAAADDDDDDRSHGETTALSHGLEQSDNMFIPVRVRRRSTDRPILNYYYFWFAQHSSSPRS